ncbi:MAG: SWIM zinc finger family protein [Candidatus Aureabacteria bacterium]|nr:SWIM zinc finger family protein [Candidatus Auribacterota bacterium]
MGWYYGWKPYVPVAARRARARKKLAKLSKKGLSLSPVEIRGRKIASTFWGEAWCGHLEKFSDYENRLPRGRSYVRNGSVCHLEIAEGAVKAMVSGSELYRVEVKIKKLPKEKWRRVKARCEGQIGSILELLQGRISRSVMAVVTDRDHGLFPLPREIEMKCSCPDWAVMCKHVAAVLYGVGARLDQSPELLFLLRGVDHGELIVSGAEMAAAAAAAPAGGKGGRRRLDSGDLERVFDIELAEGEAGEAGKRPKRGRVQPPPG